MYIRLTICLYSDLIHVFFYFNQHVLIYNLPPEIIVQSTSNLLVQIGYYLLNILILYFLALDIFHLYVWFKYAHTSLLV